MSSDEAVADVLADLGAFLNDSLATQAYARFGLMHEHSFAATLGITPENPDPTVYLATGPPSEADPFSGWPRSEVLMQTAEYGPIERRLNQQWIVYVYSGWEHEYRPRLERVHGCEKGGLKLAAFGDLRLLRNDIVHYHGIASADNSGKCEVLRHWVAIGEPILVTQEHFGEFWATFPWAELEAGPS